MLLIFISGPSGSGKTTLSQKILDKLKHGIILNTDNYYKTCIFSIFLSKIVASYFDKKISFNKKLFKSDLDLILKNGYSNYSYKYNFKTKETKKIYKKNRYIKFLIIEGIFVNEILKTSLIRKYILIKLKTNKKKCLKRVVKRDFINRGKSKIHAQRDFLKAWDLFKKNEINNKPKNYLKKISIRKKTNLKLLINKIIKLIN